MVVEVPEVCVGHPASFSESELDDFTAFVLAGGEVAAQGLRERVAQAAYIAFARENDCLLGVAGLKKPHQSYRRRIETSAKFRLPASTLPLELGWVFVLPSARGRKLSVALCRPLVAQAEGPRILVDRTQTEIVAKLKELKVQIDAGKLKPWQFGGLRAIRFPQHLYEPLLHLAGSTVEISPVPLNQGERRFVEDLKAYCESSPALLQNKELYLLRNLSKGRGVGFFEAGNFHPDFIVWLIAEDQEYISFVDPKGIRNLGAQDPKIQFHRTIKEIEERLGDSTVTLNSFVIANTPAHEMQLLWGVNKAQIEAWHVLFQQEDKDSYIDTLLTKALASVNTPATGSVSG